MTSTIDKFKDDTIVSGKVEHGFLNPKPTISLQFANNGTLSFKPTHSVEIEMDLEVRGQSLFAIGALEYDNQIVIASVRPLETRSVDPLVKLMRVTEISLWQENGIIRRITITGDIDFGRRARVLEFTSAIRPDGIEPVSITFRPDSFNLPLAFSQMRDQIGLKVQY